MPSACFRAISSGSTQPNYWDLLTQSLRFSTILYKTEFALSVEKVSLNHRLLILLGAGD
jgi:hypothetical protein